MKLHLETDRLLVRPTRIEDADFCLSIWLDDEMGKFLCDPPKEKAGSVYVDWKENVETYEGCYYFVAVSKHSNELIGTCSAVPSDDSKCWDLGYSVHKKYWQKGFGTEMVTAMIEFCSINGAHKLTAKVAKENVGSNALLNKLGFCIEKEGAFKKNGTNIVYDDYTYSMEL